MKIRQGFVSNSSSSSFIVISKKGKLTKKIVSAAFEGSKNTPFKELIPGIVKVFSDVEETSIEDFCDNYGCENLEEYYENAYDKKEIDIIKKAHKNNWKIYSGSACDDSGEISETTVCALSLNYEDENMIIYKEAYY